MRGIENLKSIDDYYQELNDVLDQIEATDSIKRKKDLWKYKATLLREINDYVGFRTIGGIGRNEEI